jgi:two-component system response regulator AtoC
VRIIAATNRDLPAMVAQGRFREDLFFRLSVFQITMPALRERRTDIPGLLHHLLAHRHADGSAAPPLAIDVEAEEMLISFPWPGNVRQLENVLHRAAILADGGCIRAADLPPEVTRASAPANSGSIGESAKGGAGEGGLRERVRRFEVSLILRAIDDASGDRRLAAQRLGIGLSSLYRKLEEFNGDAAAA